MMSTIIHSWDNTKLIQVSHNTVNKMIPSLNDVVH